MKKKTLLIILAIVFTGACVAIFLPDYESPHMIRFLIITQALFILSILIYWAAREFDFENRDRQLFYALVLLALIARAVLLIGAGDHFYLSDDVYRYIWDGKVNASGINPFRYSPTEPELEHLRDSVIYENINHPWLPTIYPPLAQNIFALSWKLGGDGTLVFKLICALFELLTCMALVVWFKLIGIRRSHVLLYLFSPLILMEFYLSAHLDILAIPFFVTALITMQNEKPSLTGVFVALAALVKFFGFFLAPLLFFNFKGKSRWKFAGALGATIVILYLPYIYGSNGNVWGSLFDYLGTWEFNGSVFRVLKFISTASVARLMCGAMFVFWIGYLIVSKKYIIDKLFLVFAGYVVLTPVLFPWYLVWILPFALRGPSWAFVYLSGAILLSYDVFIAFYSIGFWTEHWWLRVIMYGPFYVLLLAGTVRSVIKR